MGGGLTKRGGIPLCLRGRKTGGLRNSVSGVALGTRNWRGGGGKGGKGDFEKMGLLAGEANRTEGDENIKRWERSVGRLCRCEARMEGAEGVLRGRGCV